jgi:ribosomal protein L11 methyltransferase
MKIWYALEVEILRSAEMIATTHLWSHQTTGIEVSEDPQEPEWVTLRAYFASAPALVPLREELLLSLRQHGHVETALRRIELLTVADQDWLAEWKKGYEPVAIGERLLICPSWKRDQVAGTNRLVVEIDPGMAFGTGTHETTRGCLEMIEAYWRGGSFLDVGTGTGILAMAALRLDPTARVVGFDNDPEAIEVALENAVINGLDELIDLEVNRLTAYAGQEFDVVVANLTADVIVPLAPEFPQVVKRGSILILSGILREQEAEVKRAFPSWTLLTAKPENEWVTLVYQSSH